MTLECPRKRLRRRLPLNYATINILDRLKRVPGVGDVTVFGAKEYSMRVWLDPDRLASKGITVSDVAERSASRTPSSPPARRPAAAGAKVELTVPVLRRGRLQ